MKPLTGKTVSAELLDSLQQLSGSELNTFLLQLFKDRVKHINPTDVLKQFEKNRFTLPASIPAIEFKELELRWLKFAEARNFTPVTLSPLAPLGTCSAFGTVSQNNIVSAVRGTEAVSDVTNVLAMLISQQYKKEKIRSIVKYATTHRHVRGQAFSNAAFSAHFGIFCLATGGMDTGSFTFETDQLIDHLKTHLSLLAGEFDKADLSIKIYVKEKNAALTSALEDRLKALGTSWHLEIEPAYTGEYYKLVQFKVFLQFKNESINLSDGGSVDWTQRLTSNRKHRLFISGSGIELIQKLRRKN